LAHRLFGSLGVTWAIYFCGNPYVWDDRRAAPQCGEGKQVGVEFCYFPGASPPSPPHPAKSGTSAS